VPDSLNDMNVQTVVVAESEVDVVHALMLLYNTEVNTFQADKARRKSLAPRKKIVMEREGAEENLMPEKSLHGREGKSGSEEKSMWVRSS